MKNLKYWFDATDKEVVAFKNQFAKELRADLVNYWDDAEHIDVSVYKCKDGDVEVEVIVIRDAGDVVGYFHPYKGKLDRVNEVLWCVA